MLATGTILSGARSPVLACDSFDVFQLPELLVDVLGFMRTELHDCVQTGDRPARGLKVALVQPYAHS